MLNQVPGRLERSRIFSKDFSKEIVFQLVFTIDGNDIQLGQQFQHFTFDNVIQNNTVPNCFVAKLRIAPVREDDQGRQIVLRVQNQFGTKQLSEGNLEFF